MLVTKEIAGQAERCTSAWLTMLFALGCRLSVVSPKVDHLGDSVVWVVTVRLPDGVVERMRAGALHHAVLCVVRGHLVDGDALGVRMREYADMMSIELPEPPTPLVKADLPYSSGYSPWSGPSVDLEYTYTGADLSEVKP